MPNEKLLALASVTRCYRTGVPGCAVATEVLRGVSLDVRERELIVITGAAGSGKTTLLLCAAGLLRADTGTIRWPSLTTRSNHAPRDIRYVGDRAPTYGFLTVRESLAYARTLRDIDDPKGDSPPEDPLDAAGLRDLTGTRVALLSRGERARFLVALALVGAPRLLLVDDLAADCERDAIGALVSCLERVAAAGAGVVWCARTPGALPGRSSAFELVRGRLFPKPITPVESRREVPEGAPVVTTHPGTPHVRRVAEP